MLKAVSHVTLWVDDQDEALAFYTDKLGCEVRDDVTVEEMDNFRWLTVGAPAQPDLRIALLRPDTIPDVAGDARQAQGRDRAGRRGRPDLRRR